MGIDRRQFLSRSAALAGGLALGSPFRGLAAAAPPAPGYGSLQDKGEIWLPAAFSYTVVQRQGDPMTSLDPVTGTPYLTPSRFDGQATFPGPDGTTILIRNHENKRRIGATPVNEIDVIVPQANRYDPDPLHNGGVVKVLVKDGIAVESYALLGGTTHNCAGGLTPWGTWVTNEELFETNPTSGVKHGYAFEVDIFATEPVTPVPLVAMGRFEHEAIAWQGGVVYETEDRPDASFYRFTPTSANDLTSGVLEALKLVGYPTFNTYLGGTWPGGIGTPLPVEWVTIGTPDATGNSGAASVRGQAQAGGAARFCRLEGITAALGKVYFDASGGGGTGITGTTQGRGQVFVFDPEAQTLTLIYEAPRTSTVLRNPDNLVLHEPTGVLFMGEDTGSATDLAFIRGLTRSGQVFDFARADANPTEFTGICFDAQRQTMYVNQHGNQFSNFGVTYAITGPWLDLRRPDGPS